MLNTIGTNKFFFNSLGILDSNEIDLRNALYSELPRRNSSPELMNIEEVKEVFENEISIWV